MSIIMSCIYIIHVYNDVNYISFSILAGTEIVYHIVRKKQKVYAIDSIRLKLTLCMFHMIGKETSIYY